jgi:protein O-mannosyl-transferase
MNHSLEATEPSVPAAASPSRLALWLSVVLIIILTAAVYVPVINQSFSNWDDPKHVGIIWKPGWERAWRIVSDVRLQHLEVRYYSPLYFLSLMADQVLVGARDRPEAWISKLNNVLFHIANTLLLFAILLMAGAGRRAAMVGALVFAIHPIQVGTVAWIVERKNVLAVLFYLSAFLMFVKYLRSARTVYVPITITLFVAGLLSKPSVVTLPVACLAWLLIVPDLKPAGRGPAILIGLLFLVAAGFGAFVVSTEVSYPGILPPGPYRPLLAAGSIWFYLGKFVFPHELVVIYPRWDVIRHAWVFLIGFVALAVLIAAVIRYRRSMDPLMLWGGIFFLINVLPVSGLVPFGHMGHSYVADHFAYLPMIGLAVIVARGVDVGFRSLRSQPALANLFLVGVYAVVCALGLLATRQTLMWREPAMLWEATLKVNPRSPAAYLNAGCIAMHNVQIDKALDFFKKALEINPGLYLAYQNMAIIYRGKGDLETAKQMIEKAIQLNPEDELYVVMLGTMLGDQGKYEEAIQVLKKALEANPRSAKIKTQLGVSYLESGREAEAWEQFAAAQEIDPFLPDPYMQKARILLSRGEPQEAVKLLQTTTSLRTIPAAHNMLGVAYAKTGNVPMALAEFHRAYKLAPTLAGIRDNLANALMDLTQFAQAREFCLENERAGRPCSTDTLSRLEEASRDHTSTRGAKERQREDPSGGHVISPHLPTNNTDSP